METLYIPTEANYNSYRLILHTLLGVPAAAEYYEFLTNPNWKRLGQNSWLTLTIAIFECLVWLKFASRDIRFKKSPPTEIAAPILAFMLMITLWMLLFFTGKSKSHKRRTQRGTQKEIAIQMQTVRRWDALDILFWLSFTPLLFLTKQWAY